MIHAFQPVAKPVRHERGLPGLTIPFYREGKYTLGFLPLDEVGFFYQPEGNKRWVRMERKSKPDPVTVIGLDYASMIAMITIAHREQRTVDFRSEAGIVVDPDVFKTFGPREKGMPL